MENNNVEVYLIHSKKNINNAIYNNNYKKAFFLLLVVLERLDNNQKVELIDYYIKKIYNIMTPTSSFDNR
jgi:hypothetical protein